VDAGNADLVPEKSTTLSALVWQLTVKSASSAISGVR